MTESVRSAAVSSPLLKGDDAARYLHINPRTLANWRVLGKGPRYVRSGSRALYRESDLDSWITANTYNHAADERARRAGPVDASHRR